MADNKALAERLMIAAKIHEDMTGSENAMAATFREAAAALTATPSAQAGEARGEWVRVPRSMTNAMREAATLGHDDVDDAWEAVLDAAPQPQGDASPEATNGQE